MTREEKEEYKQKLIDLFQNGDESHWEQALELNKTLDILSEKELREYHPTYSISQVVDFFEKIIRKRKSTSKGDDIYDYLYAVQADGLYPREYSINERIRKALRDYEKLV